MSPQTVEKLIWTALGVGIAVLSQWPPIAGVEEILLVIAGGLPGSALFKSVDEKHAARSRASVPPPG